MDTNARSIDGGTDYACDQSETTKRRRGRPSKTAGEIRSSHITFRVTEDVKTKLETEAFMRGVSVSEVVLFRLFQSFDREQLVRDMIAMARNL